MWNTRYPSTAVILPVAPIFELKAEEQFRAAMAKRFGYPASDKRAVTGFGTSNMRPIIDGLTVGLQVLLLFIGMLTLAIGGIGLMNILLVSVNERTREIGLRRALGAKRWHIAMQFLAEALFITFAGGAVGVALSYFVTWIIPPMPMLSALFDDKSGQGDLVLRVQVQTVVGAMVTRVLPSAAQPTSICRVPVAASTPLAPTGPTGVKALGFAEKFQPASGFSA